MMLRNMQGAEDILASEAAPWHFVENVAIELAEIYGYREVRTPIFENIELFAKGMGSTSGFIENDLWTVSDKQNHRFAMRADMLMPMIRAINDANLPISRNGEPAKFYYLAPVFSASKGREQSAIQSHRFGVGAVGSTLPSLDVEAMMIAYDFFNALGLTDLKVQLNSLGCKKCRAEYQQGLYDYFSRRSGELCPKCHHRYRTHPLWTMGCEEKCCRELSQVAPSIFGYLCPECREHFEAVRTYLNELKVTYRLSPLLVPDVECYNRTVFQISCGDKMLSFGGRCDELSRLLGGRDIPAVDCSVDLDMTLKAVRDANLVPDIERHSDVCLAGSSQEAVALLLPVLYALRRAGIYAELAYPNSGEGCALEAAENSDASFVIYLDDASLRQRIVRFRELNNSFRDSHLDEAVRRIGRYFGIEGLADELRPVEVRKFSISRRQPASMRQTYEIFEPTHQNEPLTVKNGRVSVEDGGVQKIERDSNRGSRGREKSVAQLDTDDEEQDVVKERTSAADLQTRCQSMTPQERAEFEMTPLHSGNSHHSVRSRRSRTKTVAGEELALPAQEKVRAQIMAITSAVEDVLGEPENTEDGKAVDNTGEFETETVVKPESAAAPTTRRRRRRRTEATSEFGEPVSAAKSASKKSCLSNQKRTSASEYQENSEAEVNEADSEVQSAPELDAIAEISASDKAMSDEQIEQALALPKIEGEKSFAEVDEPVIGSVYIRRFCNGSHASELEENDIETARLNYDRAITASPRGRRDDYGQRRSSHRDSGRDIASPKENSLEDEPGEVMHTEPDEAEESVKPTVRRRMRTPRTSSQAAAAANYDYRLNSAYSQNSYSEHARSDYMSHYDDTDTYSDYMKYYGSEADNFEHFDYSAYSSYAGNSLEAGCSELDEANRYSVDDIYLGDDYSNTRSEDASEVYGRRSSGSRSRRHSSSSADPYKGSESGAASGYRRRSGRRSSGSSRSRRRSNR
ncbi:MAG: ATP phosphoribosyltransferase regulatory subunit [Candidatus Bruticola sp.]